MVVHSWQKPKYDSKLSPTLGSTTKSWLRSLKKLYLQIDNSEHVTLGKVVGMCLVIVFANRIPSTPPTTFWCNFFTCRFPDVNVIYCCLVHKHKDQLWAIVTELLFNLPCSWHTVIWSDQETSNNNMFSSSLQLQRHHYRELPQHVKLSLGSVPEGYIRYFTSRFPKLLMHTYYAMAMCKDDPHFHTYYP